MPPPALSCSAGAAATRRVLLTGLRPTLLSNRPTSPSHNTTTTTTKRSITSLPQTRNKTTPLARTIARPYHSTTHPPPPGPFTPAESALLSAAYHHVPTHGFTSTALALGARDAGLLDISPAILPDGGVFRLIRWHLYIQRTGLAAKVGELDREGGLGREVGERVERIAWERLRGNEEVVGRWQEVCLFLFSFLSVHKHTTTRTQLGHVY